MSYAGEVDPGFTANGSALPGLADAAIYTREAFEALDKVTDRRQLQRSKKRVAKRG